MSVSNTACFLDRWGNLCTYLTGMAQAMCRSLCDRGQGLSIRITLPSGMVQNFLPLSDLKCGV